VIQTTEGADKTSSIGPQWPPQEASFDRIKGIYNLGVVASSDGLSDIADHVNTLAHEVVDSNLSPVTRVSVRAVVVSELVRERITRLNGLLESVMPLDGAGSEFDGTSIIYLGHNHTDRQSHPDDMKKSIGLVKEAMKRPISSYSSIISRAQQGGFEIKELPLGMRMSNVQIQDQMVNLYSRFGWNRDDVLNILSNKDNIIAVAYCGDEIVSAGIAETNRVTFGDGHVLRMSEITEAATKDGFGSKGLYSAVSAELFMALDRRSAKNDIFGGKIDVAFGELNGLAPGVLNNAISQGRKFTWDIAQYNEGQEKGYLPQHVPIDGHNRQTPFSDLFPAFITRRGIKQFVGRCQS